MSRVINMQPWTLRSGDTLLASVGTLQPIRLDGHLGEGVFSGTRSKQVTTPVDTRKWSWKTSTFSELHSLGWVREGEEWVTDGSLYGGSAPEAALLSMENQIDFLRREDIQDLLFLGLPEGTRGNVPHHVPVSASGMVVTMDKYLGRLSRVSIGQDQWPEGYPADKLARNAAKVREFCHYMDEVLGGSLLRHVLEGGSKWMASEFSPDWLVYDSTKTLIGLNSKFLSSTSAFDVITHIQDMMGGINSAFLDRRNLEPRPEVDQSLMTRGTALGEYVRKHGKSPISQGVHIVPRAKLFVRTQSRGDKVSLRVVQAVDVGHSMPLRPAAGWVAEFMKLTGFYSSGNLVAMGDEIASFLDLYDRMRKKHPWITQQPLWPGEPRYLVGNDLGTAENVCAASALAGFIGLAAYVLDVANVFAARGSPQERLLQKLAYYLSVVVPHCSFATILLDPSGGVHVGQVLATGSATTVTAHQMSKLTSWANGLLGYEFSDDGLTAVENVADVPKLKDKCWNQLGILKEFEFYAAPDAAWDNDETLPVLRLSDGRGFAGMLSKWVVALDEHGPAGHSNAFPMGGKSFRVLADPVRQTALAVQGEHHFRKAGLYAAGNLAFGVIQAFLTVYVRMSISGVDMMRETRKFLLGWGHHEVREALMLSPEVQAAILAAAVGSHLIDRNDWERQRLLGSLGIASKEGRTAASASRNIIMSGPAQIMRPWVSAWNRCGWNATHEESIIAGLSNESLIDVSRRRVLAVIGDDAGLDTRPYEVWARESSLAKRIPHMMKPAALAASGVSFDIVLCWPNPGRAQNFGLQAVDGKWSWSGRDPSFSRAGPAMREAALIASAFDAGHDEVAVRVDFAKELATIYSVDRLWSCVRAWNREEMNEWLVQKHAALEWMTWADLPVHPASTVAAIAFMVELDVDTALFSPYIKPVKPHITVGITPKMDLFAARRRVFLMNKFLAERQDLRLRVTGVDWTFGGGTVVVLRFAEADWLRELQAYAELPYESEFSFSPHMTVGNIRQPPLGQPVKDQIESWAPKHVKVKSAEPFVKFGNLRQNFSRGQVLS